ncbi:endonuclease/exonuclease/phosphatase family protein [Rhizobium puerariae]|uniref:Endonuclease/exonuclease/phosphatase family protein n=1 Tax=Rhizobium puerariae TaxID=1585791 RepID=A0ABV6AI67_9HYPH
MRIVSLNAWGGRVHEPLMRYLGEVEADVLCLQEVTHVAGHDGGWLTFREGDFELPQRASLLEDVTAILPEHRAFFAPAASGPLYDGDREVASEWGLATFVRQGFPVIGQVQDFIHGDFPVSGFGAHPRPRNAHGIRIFRHDVGSAVTIVQMHGLRDLAGKGDTPARLAQAHALVGLVEKIWRRGEGLVVCGDLNLLPGSETFPILGRLELTDLVTTRGFADTRTSWYPKGGRYADYLLVTPDVKVERFDVVAEPEVSDHRALLLEIG